MNKRKLFIGVLLASAAFGLAACTSANQKPANDNIPSEPVEPGQTNKYTITFNTNGGSLVNSVEVNEGDKLSMPTNPTKSADSDNTYAFEGWYIDAALNQAYDFNLDVTSSFTLYAKWISTPITKYTVSFNTNGGSNVSSQQIIEGGKAVRPATNPTKNDDANNSYTFENWYKDAALTQVFNFDTEVINSATTIYAKWTATPIVTYQVTFITGDNATSIPTQYVKEGGTAVQPDDPTKQADAQYTYTFNGWYGDGNIPFNFNNPITKSTTVYAKWSVKTNEYTVTFISNGDTNVESKTVSYGSPVIKPNDPVKSSDNYYSYTFRAWSTSNFTNDNYDFDTPITGALTLYGWWTQTPIKHSITFNSNGGTSINSQSLMYGDKVTRPSDPTKAEDDNYTYTFAGWYTTSDFKNGTEYNFDAEITGPFTLYAKWNAIEKEVTPETYTVSFDSNGGTAVSSQTIAYGQKVTKPTDPTKTASSLEKYTFAGWYKDSSLNTPFDFNNDTITSAITLYAKWTTTPITYLVTYYNGTEKINTEAVNAGSIITYDPPVITNYTFSGWYTDSSLGDNYYFENNTEIYAATTLYAKYTKTTAGSINVTSYKGYTEGIHLELDTIPGVSQTGYVVSYKSSDASSYTAIDNELIRINDNVIVDAVGLKAGTYSVKIEANNETLTLSNITVTKDDRSGYAHFNNSNGVGAYNNDGTLKSNAVVVYVTDATKNTVTATFGGKTYTGLANILKNSKADYPIDIRILGDIGTPTWNKIEYASNVADGTSYTVGKTEVTKNGLKDYSISIKNNNGTTLTSGADQDYLVSNGFNTLDSKYTTLNGLTSKITGSEGDYDSYFNMMDISSKSNITVEGIGADATITQWGFTWKNCSYIEVKNLTFNDYPEDACSFEASDTSATTLSGLKTGYIWVHNNTFNIGKNNWDVCPEQDKHEGDGATDIKGLRNATISYNHYYKNHKTGLLGGDGKHHQANITFHHNWYQENQARLPYGRQANMHMYNNFYDSSTGTNMQIHDGGYAFIENCYFKNTSKTFEVKTNKTSQVPAIKSYQNIFDNCKNYDITNVTITTNRTEVVSNDCLFGSSFDTDSSLFYYDSTNKCSNVEIMNSASELPTLLPTVSGAGVFASLVFPNQEQGDDPTPTPTGEFVEVFSDNFSSTTATKYNGVPTNAGLTYYTFLPDNASETGNPDTYNYVEVENNAVSIVDTSSKTATSGDDGMSRTTYAYYMFDSTNQYSSGVVKYSITINLPVVASKWRILTFIDESYNGVPSEMLALYSNADKKLGYIYGSTEETPFSSAYSNGTYTIELTIDYDNDTAVLSINGTSINISNYNPQTIKGFYFMTSAGSQRSYSFTNVKIEKQDN